MEAVHGGFKGLQGQCQHKLQCIVADVSQSASALASPLPHTAHPAASHIHKSKNRHMYPGRPFEPQVACSCCAASAVTVTWSSCVAPVQFFTEESLDFQERISQRNGLGNNTFFPPSLHEEPPNCNMTTAREEAELVLFGVVQEVLDKTGQSSILCPVL